ncbi:FkbM family methyltransferase [Haloglomus litoreum]|uniref:FkbM family methyltransferase n=1 Tax=Haloglomus litoreum TaxID=3034026 RepID=UPI0023E793CC|nr:FkbM family methyltransferase [Haloglomus sp. DT116]
MPPNEDDSDPRTVVYNGVAVPTTAPEEGRDYRSEFEAGTSGELRREVRRGDDVVVVGGGRGITTVVGARMTRSDGSVTTFEANSEMLETLRRTVRVNRVANHVTLEHAAVGPISEQAESVFGPGDGERVAPSALPSCDVLELDCEGSEVAVLEGMNCRPRVVIVETHEPLGVPPGDVAPILEARGYEITNRTPAGMHGELTVLTAVRQQGGSGSTP